MEGMQDQIAQLSDLNTGIIVLLDYILYLTSIYRVSLLLVLVQNLL